MKPHPIILLLSLALLSANPAEEGQKPDRGPITVHALNTTLGKPAAGLAVILDKAEGKEWRELARGKTNDDGRLTTLLAKDHQLAAGVYRLTFETGAYFAESKTKTFYPRVEVIFEIENPKEHYHVPLLLSPFGYSTYRGS